MGEHTAFMLEFVEDFTSGSMPKYDFDLDYDGYIIEHFPKMEREDKAFAKRFAIAIDSAVDFARDRPLSDDEFRALLAEALDELLGGRDSDLF